MQQLFLIQVYGYVFPILHGPYKSDAGRLRKAKECLRDNPGTVFRLGLVDGKIEVCPFTEVELPYPHQ